MSEPFDWGKLEEWVNGPCLHCNDSPTHGVEHVAMPVTRPPYVDNYLSELAGPNEQHEISSDGHCVNPKCRAPFDESMLEPDGTVTCPNCGFEQNAMRTFESPGGNTRAGLTLEQMGSIGEQVVFRMGELPGIGAIEQANTGTLPARNPDGTRLSEPIDAIVVGQRGKFGCEIKTNHSQAQERFKIGGAQERHEKIAYCLANGLKPALIGVRLNFFTDKAFIFWREGLHDTWIGNSRMLHLATVDFSDLNPFKSPDMQAQALAVENAHLPDQSEDDEFGAIFGSVKVADFNDKHPRDDEGKFTFKEDVHELKVRDKSGKHTHNIRRCKHCGHLNQIPTDHKGRVECATCGEDPDRDLRAASVRLAGPDADMVAKQMGFQYLGRNANGHRQYVWEDESGTQHPVLVGSGAHGKRAAEIDAQRARQRMTRCINGQCVHTTAQTLQPEAEPGAPVARAGQTVMVNGEENYVMEVDGGLAVVMNTQTGAQDVVPTNQLRAVAAETDPSYLYVYYMGELHVEPYAPGVSYERMLDNLLAEFGQDLSKTAIDIDPTKVDAGEIRPRGFSVSIEHKQLSDPQVREYAERAIHDWWNKQNGSWQPEDAWYTLQRDDHVLEPRL